MGWLNIYLKKKDIPGLFKDSEGLPLGNEFIKYSDINTPTEIYEVDASKCYLRYKYYIYFTYWTDEYGGDEKVRVFFYNKEILQDILNKLMDKTIKYQYLYGC